MGDPREERAAIALAWSERIPAFVSRLDQQTYADQLAWWQAIGEVKRDGYRYKVSVVIEAYEALEVADAAE